MASVFVPTLADVMKVGQVKIVTPALPGQDANTGPATCPTLASVRALGKGFCVTNPFATSHVFTENALRWVF